MMTGIVLLIIVMVRVMIAFDISKVIPMVLNITVTIAIVLSVITVIIVITVITYLAWIFVSLRYFLYFRTGALFLFEIAWIPGSLMHFHLENQFSAPHKAMVA